MKEHYFSIVIPCYNCEKTIRNCINSILRQDYPLFEVIPVDDMSTDNTKKILTNIKNPKLKLISLKKKGFAGGARNAGKQNAKGDIIVFLDSDVTIDSNYLTILNKTYNSYPSTDGVGGSVINPYNTIVSYAVHLLTMSEQLPVGKIRYVRTNPTINTSYKKEIIKDVYFLEKNISAEDVLFDYCVSKKGGKRLFNPDLHVYHYHPRLDFKSVVKRQKFFPKGFVMSRRLYPIPGRILLRKKYLLLFLPRLILIAKRVIFTRFIFAFILSFPIILIAEIIRTIGIFKEDRKFIKNLEENKKEFRMRFE